MEKMDEEKLEAAFQAWWTEHQPWIGERSTEAKETARHAWFAAVSFVGGHLYTLGLSWRAATHKAGHGG